MRWIDPAGLRRLHILSDCLLVAIGWIAAYGLRYALNETAGYPINTFGNYLRALPLVVLPWVLTGWLFGLYRVQRMNTAVDELQSLFRSAALGALVVASIGFFFRELEIGRFVVIAMAFINLGLQGASRALFHRIERGLRRSGAHDVPTVIVGTGVAAIRLLQKIQDHPEIGYRVAGFLDDVDEEKDVAGHPVLGGLDELPRVVEEFGVREVFVAHPGLGHTRMLSLVLACEDLGVTFRVVTDLFEVLTAGTPLDLVDDLPVVRLGRQQVHPLYEPLKRAFDLTASLAGLVLAAPVLLFCAWRIRRDGPGSAFFAQDRIGKDGRRFRMYPLRTLRSDAALYAVAPRDGDDPRITPTGRWLRSTSLDELPQLLNVLKGEMSFVGPRPEMPFIVEEYDEWQRRRLAVLPGITGLWQILGRKDLPMHQNLQYDFYYIRNRSLSLDASILLRTLGAVLSRRGAF
jgi:exopolysaccharide biosynthesis polyprenyl glycosylphosphotransferase